MNTENQRISNAAMRALAIVGVIAIVLLGLWGVIQAVRLMPNVFSGLASAVSSLSSVFVPAEHIDITVADHTVTAGQPFTLSFTKTGGSSKGSYSFVYDCRDGVSFQAPDSSGTYRGTFCNTPFNFNGASKDIRLVALSTKNRYIDVPLRVRFTPEGKNAPSAESLMTLTISNPSVTGSPATTGSASSGSTGSTAGGAKSGSGTKYPGTTTTGTYVITGGSIPTNNPYGRVDLSARILEIGVIDRVTNVFTNTGVVHRGDRAAVRFAVENIGDKTSDYWYFNAVLPTMPFYIFSSDVQPPLNPGDRIEYTIGFDAADPSVNNSQFVVNVDPSGAIPERDKSNNVVRVTLSIQ